MTSQRRMFQPTALPNNVDGGAEVRAQFGLEQVNALVPENARENGAPGGGPARATTISVDVYGVLAFGPGKMALSQETRISWTKGKWRPTGKDNAIVETPLFIKE